MLFKLLEINQEKIHQAQSQKKKQIHKIEILQELARVNNRKDRSQFLIDKCYLKNVY